MLRIYVGALALVASVVGPQPTYARTQPKRVVCQTITSKQVAALFDRWNDSLSTKTPDAVVANYAPDATLLPTVQSGPLVGPAAIRGYFVDFLKKSPRGAIDDRVIHVGCSIAYDIGLYTFTVDGDQPGTHSQVKARYTFIYAPEHGRWLIVHHHSSAVPESSK